MYENKNLDISKSIMKLLINISPRLVTFFDDAEHGCGDMLESTSPLQMACDDVITAAGPCAAEQRSDPRELRGSFTSPISTHHSPFLTRTQDLRLRAI